MFHFFNITIMLQTTVIGYLGADAEVKNLNGKEFTTMRIAHTSKWTDGNGTVHEETIWVDCIMNGSSAVNEYLKKGQLVYVVGNTSLRVYSSAKDRCMKAGLTVNVKTIELLGSKTDDVPSLLYKAETGEQVEVRKFYHAFSCVGESDDAPVTPLLDSRGRKYKADPKGWIYPENNDPANAQQ